MKKRTAGNNKSATRARAYMVAMFLNENTAGDLSGENWRKFQEQYQAEKECDELLFNGDGVFDIWQDSSVDASNIKPAAVRFPDAIGDLY